MNEVNKKGEKNTLFNLTDVDVFEEDNTLWFCLPDIGKVLEVLNTRDWNKWFDEDEVKVSKKSTSVTGQSKTYISESALYRVLNKTNSPKAKPFERWVTKCVIPSIRKNGYYVNPQQVSKSEKELEIIKMQTELERAKYLSNLALKYNGKSETFAQILDAHAVKEITGEFIIPLPALERKTYSATEIGKILGISAQKVGSIANKLNIKNNDYGQFFVDKSKYSNKEVEVFRYFDNAVELIKAETDA